MAKQTGSIDLKASKNLGDIATDTAQYFWFTSGGSDNGAHITEVDKTTFQNTPTGGNVLATSNGIAVRDGLKELATMEQGGFEAKTYDSNDNEVVIAHLGYGPGTDSGGGTSDAPYYTLGIRATGSTVGNYSCAEGYNTTASGYFSHSEGDATTASGSWSHSEGVQTTASGKYSHAEGRHTTASGEQSHAENNYTNAVGNSSHAEGSYSESNGTGSHAEGYSCKANGDYSHAQNYSTRASSNNQTALGKYNIEDNSSTYIVIIGNGTADNARSNALTVDWAGDVCLALDTTAASGTTDGDLYAAITALGWQSDVIV